MARRKTLFVRAAVTCAFLIVTSNSTRSTLVASSGAEGQANLALAWDAPSEGALISYVIEAGSAPGRSDITVFDAGPATILHVAAVPAGTYYVRVRSRSAEGLSDPSNEIVVTIGRGRVGFTESSCSTPLPPTGLTATVRGPTITLTWEASTGAASYQLEAGSTPGASDLFNRDLGALNTFQARVSPGDYFVRVRATSSCGASTPSTELTIRVQR